MPHSNYIQNLLNIKDQNITIDKNGVCDEFINNKTCKIIDAHLSYIPASCDKCGCIFESNNDLEKKELIKVLMLLFHLSLRSLPFCFLRNKEFFVIIVIIHFL